MTDQVCCREHLAVYNLLQFLIEPPDGKTYHVVVIAFDFLYMDGEIPLYAVSSGFVEGIAGFYVNVQVVLVDGIKGHVRLLVKCADGDLSMLSYDKRDSGIYLMGPVREQGEHVVSFGFVRRLSKNLTAVDDDRVRADDGEIAVLSAA